MSRRKKKDAGSYRPLPGATGDSRTSQPEARDGSRDVRTQSQSIAAEQLWHELAKIVAGALIGSILTIVVPKVWNALFVPKNDLATSTDAAKNSLPEMSASRAVSDVRSVFRHRVTITNTGAQTAIGPKISIEPVSSDIQLELVEFSSSPHGWQHLINPRDSAHPKQPHVRIVELDRLGPEQTLVLIYVARSKSYFPSSFLTVKAVATKFEDVSRPGAQLYRPSRESIEARSYPGSSDVDHIDTVAPSTTAGTTTVNIAGSGFNASAHIRLDTTPGDSRITQDSNGHVVLKSPSGGRVHYHYDNAGRLTSRTTSKRERISYEYDANGNLSRVSDSSGGTTVYTYDALDRLTSRTTAKRQYGYQSADPRWAMQAPVTESYTYDATGNRLSSQSNVGEEVRYVYDASGNRIARTDSLGRSTTYAYDANGYLTATTDAIGNTTQFQYDATGHLVAVINPFGEKTTFTYDANGRRVSSRRDRGVEETADSRRAMTTAPFQQNSSVYGTTDKDNHGTYIQTVGMRGGRTRHHVVEDRPIQLAAYSISSNLCGPKKFCLALDLSTAGNDALTTMALIAGYKKFGDERYLYVARSLGDSVYDQWVQEGTTGPGVYTVASYDPSGTAAPGGKARVAEHSANMFVAFTSLAEVTKHLGLGAESDEWDRRARVAEQVLLETVAYTSERVHRHVSGSELPLRVRVLNEGGADLKVTTSVIDANKSDTRRGRSFLGTPPSEPVRALVLSSGGARLEITSSVEQ